MVQINLDSSASNNTNCPCLTLNNFLFAMPPWGFYKFTWTLELDNLETKFVNCHSKQLFLTSKMTRFVKIFVIWSSTWQYIINTPCKKKKTIGPWSALGPFVVTTLEGFLFLAEVSSSLGCLHWCLVFCGWSCHNIGILIFCFGLCWFTCTYILLVVAWGRSL